MKYFWVTLTVLSVLRINVLSYSLTEDDIPELKYMNTSVNPCDDFYEFSCGNFKNVHPRPEDKVLMDHFSLLTTDIIEITKQILESNNNPEDPIALKKARTAYKSCLETQYADTMPNPELSVIQEVNGFPMVAKNKHNKHLYKSTPFSWYEIADLIAEYGIPMLFGTIQSLPNYVDASKTQLYVYKEQLLLPQTIRPSDNTPEDTIEKSLEEFAKQKNVREEKPFDVFLKNVTMKLKLATGNYWTNDDDILQNLDDTKTFMVNLYNADIVEDEILPLIPENGFSVTIRNMQKWTKQQFGNKSKINWLKFFRIIFKKTGLKLTEDTEILCGNTFAKTLYGLINLVENADSDILKNYCLLRIFLYLAPDSDAQTREAFELYYKEINQQVYSRDEYCTRKIIDSSGTASLSFAVAYEYQLRFFNVNKLQKATDMIYDLWGVFTDILSNEIDWMDEESKTHAITKIENMITLLGYPDQSEDKEELDDFYKNLRICSWDNYGNSKRLRSFKLAYQLSQAKSRDRTIWDKSPFDANAYYTRATNRIIFPVAMLNPVFFNGNISILDYSRIGSIIGHEITHGFDNSGSKYNEEGLVAPWLSPESQRELSERAECFKEQYGKYYIPEAGVYVNGTKTLDENLADNGGVRESYKAVKKYLSRNKIYYKLKNYTTEQLFFIGFGTMWCSDASDYYYKQLAATGSYPPTRWRVNGPLSNLEEFSTAFNCPVGSNMNPENKCRLW